MPQRLTFWDRRSRHYDDGVKKHGAIYERKMSRMRSLLGRSDVVLEFACTTGELSLDIAPLVERVQGIDLSVKMIERAAEKVRARGVGNVEFEQMEVFDPRLQPRSYSAIVAFNIFHLIEDGPALMARLHDLLTPGGLLISKTPCLGEWGWVLKSLIGLAQKAGVVPPIVCTTSADLEALVSGSGFKIVESVLWEPEGRTQWIVARKPEAS